MSKPKRLQVVMSDSELGQYERIAKARGVTLSDWVRHALRAASRAEPRRAPERKLSVIRAAVQHAFPAPDIDQMLVEIGAGHADLPE